ncbi:hypothetical protein D5S18_21990 [Nocardia panacis]|uniref:Caspase family protein n=1 Tax=Nocardia panacis TaxID=2340916 RepID=A0A3A4KFR1_9NOCA|nr:caspase family protein [Nocardia panacis]RJO72957.1 hypothetical protein D5S18_21990 [Nocardia panacis]
MRLPDSHDSRVVLIGTSRYAEDSGFASLPAIARSVRELAEFLRATTGLEHVQVVLDPPDAVPVSRALSAAEESAVDLLLFYYVGHGVAIDNELHLTHGGSRAEDAAFTTVPYSAVRARIRAARAKVKIVVLDCCHSGKAFGRDVLAADPLGEVVDIEGAFVLTATDEKTKFAAAADAEGRTAFTGALLALLRGGIPGGERYLTMSALYRELRARLPADNLPKPKALERGTAAELALAPNPAWRAPEIVLPSTESAAYFAQVRDIAPLGPLVDREIELAELNAFCDGPEPYLWWRAGPWAGKTALMSWFALHPPAHVRVVAFFITSRLAAQSDHVAFTEAVLDQLSVLLPAERIAVSAMGGNRDTLRRHLLDLAARRAAESGGRILLIVDGLDEDQGTPSIASLLPKHPGPGLRVLVASRPNPPVPLDVAGGHPLRTCRHRPLAQSKYAHDIRRAAQYELSTLLAHPGEAKHLGLITAAGGLTKTELADITGLPPYHFTQLLSGIVGRSFRARTTPFDTDSTYLFAHETLREEAENALGPALVDEYREQIHRWAEGYRAEGWPPETPNYLLTRYFSMLRTREDLPRMTALALDRARHDRMLHRTGGDIAARTEIAAVGAALAGQPDPDLLTLCRLALHRDRLAQRSNNIPTGLPAAFARLGAFERAANLARSLPDPVRRTEAHIALAAVPRDTAGHEQDRLLAESLVREIKDDSAEQERLCAELIAALVAVGDIGNAEKLIDAIHDPYLELIVQGILVPVWLEAGRPEDALRALRRVEILAERFVSAKYQGRAQVALARALAEIGEFDRAESIVHGIDNPADRIAAAGGMLRALSRANLTDRARTIAEEMARIPEDEPETTRKYLVAVLIRSLAEAGFGRQARALHTEDDPSPEYFARLIDLGELDLAEQCARRIAAPEARADALTDLIVEFLDAGRESEARQLAEEVEADAIRMDNPLRYSEGLFALAGALLEAGELPLARAAAARIPLRFLRIRALVAQNGDLARFAGPRPSVSATGDGHLLELVEEVLLQHRLHPDTEPPLACAEQAVLHADHAEAALRLATILIEIGLARAGFDLIVEMPSVHHQISILAELGGPLVEAGLLEPVRRRLRSMEPVVRRLTDEGRPAVLRDLGIAYARIGDLPRAQTIAAAFDDLPPKAHIQLEIVAAHVKSGDLDIATELADTITYIHERIHALLTVAAAHTDRDTAEHLLTRAEHEATRIRGHGEMDDIALHLVDTALHLAQFDRTRTSADLADHPKTRAEALLRLTNALLTHHPIPHTEIHHLLADIWNTTDWYRPLPALAHLSPTLLRTLAQEILNPTT